MNSVNENQNTSDGRLEKGGDSVAGQYPHEELARAIIKRIAKSAIRLAIMRHGLCDDFGDPLDPSTEDEIIEDVIDCMSGDDSGCLDPEELDATNCEMIYLDAVLGCDSHSNALALATKP